MITGSWGGVRGRRDPDFKQWTLSHVVLNVQMLASILTLCDPTMQQDHLWKECDNVIRKGNKDNGTRLLLLSTDLPFVSLPSACSTPPGRVLPWFLPHLNCCPVQEPTHRHRKAL